MWCPLALVLPIVLRGSPPLPYVVEAGLNILVDSGASASYLRQAVLDAGGPVAALAPGAQSVEATAPLRLPADCGGILGFDALGAARSFELDLRGPRLLRLDEAAGDDEPRCVATVTATAFGGTRPYPTVPVVFYGAGECECDALLDTGTPLTIANGALAARAGLLDGGEAAEAPSTTVGVDGARTELRTLRAAGLVLGGGLELASLPVLVGDLPQWDQLGIPPAEPASVVGLDVLGERFRCARARAAAKKKTRRDPSAAAARKTRGSGRAAPRPGETWTLQVW